ncbi:PREDICTED: laccase-1-like [Amphimedon queenslandica]|uniref:Uncharacterized protein n=1 Tax=Amphimedon queenslandica TaxID=400682 RepID=A0A1X7VE65_AMPQE|nr:PREDICTED: laccase-1-like [Amphimedon queenslandica]|eukprot:XP_003384621.1 PREDICTED: laccase-1-like [Amphimedon queenslandica]
MALLLMEFSLITLSLLSSSVLSYRQYNVPCTPFTPSCVCPLMDEAGKKVEVCLFSLKIQTLRSFTSYYLPSELEGRVGHGSNWYINSTSGEFLPSTNSKGKCNKAEKLMASGTCSIPSSLDGYTYRPFIAVNGQFPGPTLIVHYNQTLTINVSNWLSGETVAIHWHGLNQRGTNWMDGVQGLTQCGLEPGQSFKYIFQADPPGTYWYHGHSGSLRADGLFGALIIKEDMETLNKVREKTGLNFTDDPDHHTVTLFDLQQFTASQVHSLVHSAPSIDSETSKGTEKVVEIDHGATEASHIPFWSGLINGKGRHPNTSYASTRLSIFSISPSRLYRFRIIGSQSVYSYLFSIDEHSMTVLATDGSFVEPMLTDYLIVSSGERYDILVQGKGIDDLNERTSFMIRARTLEPIPNSNVHDPLLYRADHTAEALLHYDVSPEPNSTQYTNIALNSIPIDDKCTEGDPCFVLNCPFPSFPPSYNITCLHVHQLKLLYPSPNEDLPHVVPDKRVFLNFAFSGYDGMSLVNARNFKMPIAPLSLLNSSELDVARKKTFCKDVKNSSLCDSFFSPSCLCTNVKTVSFNQSLQMVFSALGPNPDNVLPFFKSHPIHLHGHQFKVVDVQFGSYDSTGRLSRGNADIDCGGSHLCTVPDWKSGRDYSIGREGKVDPLAPLKDTIQVPAGGYVVAYVRTINPGHWFLHCHNDHHLSTGMGSVLSEAIDMLPQPPIEMKRQCYTLLDVTSDCINGTISENGHICHREGSVSLGAIFGLFFLILVSLVLLAAAITHLCYCIKCCKAKKHDHKGASVSLLMTRLDGSDSSENET